MPIGHAGVLVTDRRGEEFQEAALRPVAGIGDDQGHDNRRRSGGGIFWSRAAGLTVSWRPL